MPDGRHRLTQAIVKQKTPGVKLLKFGWDAYYFLAVLKLDTAVFAFEVPSALVALIL